MAGVPREVNASSALAQQPGTWRPCGALRVGVVLGA